MSETGKVKFFIKNKGYGFITHDTTNEDIFFHITQSPAISEDVINDGLQVSFAIADGKRGKVAVEITEGAGGSQPAAEAQEEEIEEEEQQEEAQEEIAETEAE
tara:strand:- start:90 stop:398 length:309 start_codon:yes stop_codon:yes gene_type:complete